MPSLDNKVHEATRGEGIVPHRLLSRLDAVKQTGKQKWRARCPAHGDENPSLDVAVKGHRILVNCRSQGCTARAIVNAVGLSLADLFLDDRRNGGRETARWAIRDLTGSVVAEHVRYDRHDGKDIVWCRNGKPGLGRLKLRDMPLYGGERLADLSDGETVVVCEGEKATDAARRAGLSAVGTVTGARLIPADHVLEPLVRFRVVLWPDADDDGVTHMRRIAQALVQLGVEDLSVVDWPDAPPKGDAADATSDHVRELVGLAPAWNPADTPQTTPETMADSPPLTESSLAHAEADLAHAEILAELWRDRVRWAPERGMWRAWSGKVWELRTEEQVAVKAKEDLRVHYAEALAKARSAEDVNRIAKLVRDTCRHARLAQALAFLKGWDGFHTDPENWDADLWLLNCANGIVDLRTLELRRHDPADLCTMIAPTPYDPTATSPEWDVHLAHFQPDADVRRQLKRDLGTALVGDVLREILPVFYGGGGNAKTTTLAAIAQVIGDYAHVAMANLLVERRHDRHPTEIADLRGKRLVICEEVPLGSSLDESKVKHLTGSRRISARYVRENPFSFPRTWTIVLDCNHRPAIKGSDAAIWRRVRVVPWLVSAENWPGRKPMAEVLAILQEAGPAILRWLVDGLRDWHEAPQWVAEQVTVATEQYRQEQDRLGDFLADRCEERPSYAVSAKDLYAAYVAWCDRAGEEPLKKRTFGERLTDLGFPPWRTGSARLRSGLRLKPYHADDVDTNTEADATVTHGDASSVLPLRESERPANTEDPSPYVTRGRNASSVETKRDRERVTHSDGTHVPLAPRGRAGFDPVSPTCGECDHWSKGCCQKHTPPRHMPEGATACPSYEVRESHE